MISGCLIAESLRPGAELETSGVRIVRITRKDVSDSVTAQQPPVWTLIDFEADAGAADVVAAVLAESLDAEGGWYADFTTGEEHVVVYANKVFRYAYGDASGRAEAVAYGKTVGVPDHQLDWDNFSAT